MNHDINLMAIRDCRLSYNFAYRTIVTLNIQYCQWEEALAKKKEKGTEVAQFTDIAEKIELWSKKFMAGNNNQFLEQELYKTIEFEELQIFPEHQAILAKEGK